MSDEQSVETTVAQPLTTVAGLQAFVADLFNSEPSDLPAGARGYTIKGGFRAVSTLRNTPLNTLVGMGACINDAIAGHIVEGTEGAQDGMQLVINHAQNAVTAQSNQAQFDSFYSMAQHLGYADDIGENPSIEDMTAVVDTFLVAQPKQQNSWAEHLAAQGA